MLLVLFVMFVSALLGLLVTQYVRDMINISGLYSNYYKTYFQAYWGLELGLAQINYRLDNPDNPSESWNPFGFEDAITYTAYSECTNDCSFDMTISARNSVIGDTYTKYDTCADDLDPNTIDMPTSEYYSISSWDGFITPLFYDAGVGFDVPRYYSYAANVFIWWSVSWEEPLLYNRYTDWSWSWETYLIRITDEELENFDVNSEESVWSPSPFDEFDDIDWVYHNYEGSSWFNDPSNKNYLIVANASGEPKSFCLENVDDDWSNIVELPMKYMVVESVAENNATTVAFWAVKTNELPSYLIYWTITP